MTLEAILMSIDDKLGRLLALAEGGAAPAPAPAPVPQTTFSAPAPAPAPVPPAFQDAPAPAPAQAPAQASAALPFHDGPTLLAYAQAKYRALGVVKGAHIQSILTALGVQNLTALTPDKYAMFYAQVEAL